MVSAPGKKKKFALRRWKRLHQIAISVDEDMPQGWQVEQELYLLRSVDAKGHTVRHMRRERHRIGAPYATENKNETGEGVYAKRSPKSSPSSAASHLIPR